MLYAKHDVEISRLHKPRGVHLPFLVGTELHLHFIVSNGFPQTHGHVGSIFTSNRLKKLGINLYISNNAICFPRHVLDPPPNWNMALFILFSRCSSSAPLDGSASHRSGLQTSTSSPKTSLWRCTTQGLQPTTVSPGINWPQMYIPWGGTIRSKIMPMAG